MEQKGNLIVNKKIEVLPETPQFQVSHDVLLRSSPSEKGAAVLPVKKGAIVQEIDEMKGII